MKASGFWIGYCAGNIIREGRTQALTNMAEQISIDTKPSPAKKNRDQ